MPTLTPLVPVESTTEFVPRSGGVVASGADIFESKLAAGDAQPAFQILGSGKQEWGAGGASALDTNLYRFTANALATDDHLLSVRSVTGDAAFSARISTDGNARLTLRASGNLEWGDGTAAADTNLYRVAANTLGTDDLFRSNGGYEMLTAGNFYMAVGAGRTGQIFMSFSGDSAPFRFGIYNNGDHEWGPGGGAARDTNLYRAAAGILQTDGGLVVGDATPGDNFPLFKFNTSRAWQFETDGVDGASQQLALRTLTGSKQFSIQDSDGTLCFSWVTGSGAGAGSIGFFGTTATTKKTVTGAKGSNAALASLLTQLAAYGLITDSTTA